jgi:hypothetical protein
MRLSKLFAPTLVAGAAVAVAGCASHGEAGRPAAAPPASALAPASAPADASDYDALLAKRVSDGMVDYAGWKADPVDMARFDSFLRWQGDADVRSMSLDEKIAFYVNAYNACCIKLCLDHYPLHSPLDVEGFFDKDKNRFRVGGENLSPAEIEYDRLVPLQDMRAHFAIVCSDRGCPPLRAAAYHGATIDQELEDASRRFVLDKRNLIVDPKTKQVQISKLFEWYGKDFTSDPKRPAAKPELYLLNWAEGDAKSVLAGGGYELKIIEWNWTLNEKAKPQP